MAANIECPKCQLNHEFEFEIFDGDYFYQTFDCLGCSHKFTDAELEKAIDKYLEDEKEKKELEGTYFEDNPPYYPRI